MDRANAAPTKMEKDEPIHSMLARWGHFDSVRPGKARNRSMFTSANPHGYLEPFAGVRFKTLVHGERTLFAEFRLARGHQLPRHSHPHEQTGYLVSGHIVLTIGAEVFEVRPGDSWCIPGNVEHEASIIDDSVAIEVFSPVREEYLPKRPAE